MNVFSRDAVLRDRHALGRRRREAVLGEEREALRRHVLELGRHGRALQREVLERRARRDSRPRSARRRPTRPARRAPDRAPRRDSRGSAPPSRTSGRAARRRGVRASRRARPSVDHASCRVTGRARVAAPAACVCASRHATRRSASARSVVASIATANSAAFAAPALPIANVATGTPRGICTIEYSESSRAGDATGPGRRAPARWFSRRASRADARRRRRRRSARRAHRTPASPLRRTRTSRPACGAPRPRARRTRRRSSSTSRPRRASSPSRSRCPSRCRRARRRRTRTDRPKRFLPATRSLMNRRPAPKIYETRWVFARGRKGIAYCNDLLHATRSAGRNGSRVLSLADRRDRTMATEPAPTRATPRHIRLTSHPGQPGGAGGSLPIRWGAATAVERGPVVGTTTNRSQRNVIGTHSGSYGVYRALAVAAGSLTRGHRADLTNTSPTDPIGPYPQWATRRRSCRSTRGARRSPTSSPTQIAAGLRHPPDHRRHEGAHRPARDSPRDRVRPARARQPRAARERLGRRHQGRDRTGVVAARRGRRASASTRPTCAAPCSRRPAACTPSSSRAATSRSSCRRSAGRRCTSSATRTRSPIPR